MYRTSCIAKTEAKSNNKSKNENGTKTKKSRNTNVSCWFIIYSCQILRQHKVLVCSLGRGVLTTPTFFRYLVVFPTARTPFRMALVLKWCNTTWEGTGKTLASSVIPRPSSLARDTAPPGVVMSAPLAVVTGISIPSSLVVLVIPNIDLPLFFPLLLLSSLSRSRSLVRPACAGPLVFGRTFRMSLSRWRGRVGAGGMLGAGTPDEDPESVTDDAR
jgi:hypothetical protein